MKAETKFTPAPWEVDIYGDVQANGDDVARLAGDYSEEVNASNARLIAAAPDMYAALKPFAQKQFHEVLAGNTQGDDSILWERNGASLTIGDFRCAAAALAKAEGKS